MQPIAWLIATLDAAMILAVVVIMLREENGDPAKPGHRRQRSRLPKPQ